jgi:hypothetical protein
MCSWLTQSNQTPWASYRQPWWLGAWLQCELVERQQHLSMVFDWLGAVVVVVVIGGPGQGQQGFAGQVRRGGVVAVELSLLGRYTQQPAILCVLR